MSQPTSWWIASSEHTLVEEVPAAPADVRAYYVDMDNIKAVHPLVVAVDSLGREETADGYLQTYRVRDRLPLGPFALGIAYTARISVPRSGDVHTEARQFPRVILTGVVSFDGTEASTRVTERVRIEAPRPLASVTVRQALKAHVEMLAGIRRSFE